MACCIAHTRPMLQINAFSRPVSAPLLFPRANNKRTEISFTAVRSYRQQLRLWQPHAALASQGSPESSDSNDGSDQQPPASTSQSGSAIAQPSNGIVRARPRLDAAHSGYAQTERVQQLPWVGEGRRSSSWLYTQRAEKRSLRGAFLKVSRPCTNASDEASGQSACDSGLSCGPHRRLAEEPHCMPSCRPAPHCLYFCSYQLHMLSTSMSPEYVCQNGFTAVTSCRLAALSAQPVLPRLHFANCRLYEDQSLVTLLPSLCERGTGAKRSQMHTHRQLEWQFSPLGASSPG
jgi:hypothetical protein